ncbi:DUF1330 domain-containing protein [Nocardioides sp. CFH 31398]|uniref:DUF1330 domain-containing protein n=1 Tax=Nocardioides sp. CFH 31398 TaxID=2919579 RepID=UPI001F05ADE5|nr:DUF1330 domain-containing protein [Nocardioides sp. CFH 31398]MCH1866208.1 DUF1330 domain-containing protein [Nocardioides sp. CFH 31398]
MIDPTGQDLKAFLEAGPDEPVVMLNLLRFAEGGQAGYLEYLRHFRPHAEARGARVLHYGLGGDALVAEDGQAWDAVLVVSYPTRRSFSEMVRDPAYRAGAHLRTESLVEAVLQPTVPVDL